MPTGKALALKMFKKTVLLSPPIGADVKSASAPPFFQQLAGQGNSPCPARRVPAGIEPILARGPPSIIGSSLWTGPFEDWRTTVKSDSREKDRGNF